MIQYIKINIRLQIASLIPIKCSLIFGQTLDDISYKFLRRVKAWEIIPLDVVTFVYLFRPS